MYFTTEYTRQRLRPEPSDLDTMVDLPNVAQACADVMKAAGFRRVAVVRETASWDQAFLSASNTHILIRCAAEANEADLRALETIVIQGPFDHVVYVVEERPPTSGPGYIAMSLEEFRTRVSTLFA